MFIIAVGCAPVILEESLDDAITPVDIPINTIPDITPPDSGTVKPVYLPREKWSANYYKFSWSDRGEDVLIVRSVDEMAAFYDETGINYLYGAMVVDGYDVLDYGTYTDSFFSDRFLLMVLSDASSGSIRHKVTSISNEDDVLTVNIDRHAPELQTMDMPAWAIVIELSNEYTDFTFDVIWKNVPFDIKELTAPADDLLSLEFVGFVPSADRVWSSTYETITAVMFVFDGIHDMFNLGAITRWGELLSFDDETIIEHDYIIAGGKNSFDRVIFDGKTGFLLYFDTPIYDATYGVGTYTISFEYFGVAVETEPVTVVERPRQSR